MALPIQLHTGWYSVQDALSPNAITANGDVARFGRIDGVSYMGDSIFSIGQYGLFKIKPDTFEVTYNNQRYYLVTQANFIFCENAVPIAT